MCHVVLAALELIRVVMLVPKLARVGTTDSCLQSLNLTRTLIAVEVHCWHYPFFLVSTIFERFYPGRQVVFYVHMNEAAL